MRSYRSPYANLLEQITFEREKLQPALDDKGHIERQLADIQSGVTESSSVEEIEAAITEVNTIGRELNDAQENLNASRRIYMRVQELQRKLDTTDSENRELRDLKRQLGPGLRVQLHAQNEEQVPWTAFAREAASSERDYMRFSA